MTQYGVTNIHPLALVATLLAGIVLLTSRRSTAVLALAIVACLIPVAQRVVVVSLDFNMIRLLIVFGWIRVLARGEIRSQRWNDIDVAFLAWTFAASVMFVIREESVGAFSYRLGLMFDAIGVFLLLRVLVQRPSDSVQAMRYLAVCAAVVMMPMTLEWSTGRNLFSVFGGVQEFTIIRDGKFRCQGAFTHPIMAGSFGACLVPVFLGMYRAFPDRRKIAIVGMVSGTVITFLASSSGPLISLLAGVGAFFIWPWRAHTRALRWAAVVAAVVVHFVREKPVWHMIARVSDLLGGEGYHRYSLINAFLNHWSEWILYGTRSTDHWGFMLWDTTNQYVEEGVTGGILALGCFVAVLALAFRGIGVAGRSRGPVGRSRKAQSLWCWGLGCGLFAHATAFISVSYYGQMRVLFVLFLTVIAAEYSFALSLRNKERVLAAPRVAAPTAPGTDPAST